MVNAGCLLASEQLVSISEHTRAISGPAAGVLKTKGKKANVRVIVPAFLKQLDGLGKKFAASGLRPKFRVNRPYTVHGRVSPT
jgi:hypothetical protein